MNKTISATVLLLSGISIFAQPMSFGRELRKVLVETAPVKALPVAVAKAAPVVTPVASIPVSHPITVVSPTSTKPLGTKPILTPVRPVVGPMPTDPIIFPTDPIIFPTDPISPP